MATSGANSDGGSKKRRQSNRIQQEREDTDVLVSFNFEEGKANFHHPGTAEEFQAIMALTSTRALAAEDLGQAGCTQLQGVSGDLIVVRIDNTLELMPAEAIKDHISVS